jgi:hypothetical protein
MPVFACSGLQQFFFWGGGGGGGGGGWGQNGARPPGGRPPRAPVVKNGDTCCFAARARGSGQRKQGPHGAGHGQPLPNGCVYKVKKRGPGVRRVQVGGLCRVHHGAAAHRHKGIRAEALRLLNGSGKRGVRGLHAARGKHRKAPRRGRKARARKRVQRARNGATRPQRREIGVRKHHNALRAAGGNVRANFARHARAKADGGRGHLKGVVGGGRRSGGVARATRAVPRAAPVGQRPRDSGQWVEVRKFGGSEAGQ